DELPGRGIGDLDRRIRAAPGEAPAVRSERHTLDSTVRIRDGAHERPVIGAPKLHRLVLAPRSQVFPIRAEGDARCVPFVPGFEHGEFLAGTHIPDAYRAVITGRGEESAGGVEGHAADVPGVPVQLVDFLAGVRVPNEDDNLAAIRSQ